MLSHFNCVWLFVTLWTTACQAPLSMGFSRQEFWSGLPFPTPRDLPNLEIEPAPLTSTGIGRRVLYHYLGSPHLWKQSFHEILQLSLPACITCLLPGALLIAVGFHDSILPWFSLNLSAHPHSPFSTCLLDSDEPRILPLASSLLLLFILPCLPLHVCRTLIHYFPIYIFLL